MCVSERQLCNEKMKDRGWKSVKYIVVLADGMADLPIAELGGKTPLEYANTPAMDALAQAGQVGLVQNVPTSMKPGSDVANLAVLGYNPEKNYSGRSPLEALSVGVDIDDTDVVFRCNLVTLSEDEPYEDKTILDHSSGEISTEDADALMDAVRRAFNTEQFSFYTGTSYRHIAVWKNGKVLNLEPPHDHLGSVIKDYLPRNPMFRDMMRMSFEILNNHPINLKRAAEGKNKANSLWFWGAGTKPSLQNFREKTGMKGAMISAVDLLKGIAVGSGMKSIDVEGANGGLDTNYTGKADAALRVLLEDGADYAFIHVEAPDEMGHQGSAFKKVQAIERIDSQIVKRVQDVLDEKNVAYRMLVLPDHPTPVSLRTHTSDPVPYVLFDSTAPCDGVKVFSENEARLTGKFEPLGYKLIEKLIG